MAEKVLFILLDAFRHDYINSVDTPFLYSKISKGVYAKKLRSVTGFTQRTAIFTGITGADSGAFTTFTFDSENSPFRFLRELPSYYKMLRKQSWWNDLPDCRGINRVKKYLNKRSTEQEYHYRNWIQQEARRYSDLAPVLNIPLVILPEIGVSEDDRPIYLPGARKEESIFDVFTKENINYKYLMYPLVNVDDDVVLEEFLKHNTSEINIILGQFSESDFLVHQCGPSSGKRHQVIGEVDRKLREIASIYNEYTTWIIIGDHGMTDVREEVNILDLLESIEQKCDVEMGKDYLLFLDSTMARFRWITRNGKTFLDKVRAIEYLSEMGRFIDDEIAKKYEIPIQNRKYGDLIWWANNGVLIFPDFFHDNNTHSKGMHGFDTNNDDMKGFFLAFGPNISPKKFEEVNLIDVCPTIAVAVGVSAPKNSYGKSLICFDA